MKKIAGVLGVPALLTFLASLPLTGEWAESIRPLAPWLIATAFSFLLFFMVWNAAIAFHVSKGPIIWIGEVTPKSIDPGEKIDFGLRVKNAGNGEVEAFLYVVELREDRESKNRRSKTDVCVLWNQYTIHDQIWKQYVRLFGEKYGFATICTIYRPTESKEYFALSAFGNSCRVEDKKKVTLILRVDFHEPIDRSTEKKDDDKDDDKRGRFLKSQTKTVCIVFDLSVPEMCQITQS